MGSFWGVLAKVLVVLPAAVQLTESIYKMKKEGADKRDLAHASAIAASGVADVFIDPSQKPLADAVTAVVHQNIDAIVNTANLVGEFTHSDKPKNSEPAVPAAVPAAVPEQPKAMTVHAGAGAAVPA